MSTKKPDPELEHNLPHAAPGSVSEVGIGPTPGNAEGADGPFRGYPGEVGPGPTPGSAEGEPEEVNEDLPKQT